MAKITDGRYGKGEQLTECQMPFHMSKIAGKSGRGGGRCGERRGSTTEEVRSGAWLRPISRGNWHFDGWRFSFSKSGPRLESRSLRQSALENMTNLSRMESPLRDGRNKSDGDDNGCAGGASRRTATGERGGGRGVWERREAAINLGL
ncbi:hypothetical protein F511_30091 [Dorcoceras hygrometricum]|uniref:Uncharacterized protein n=1 Tax=Dorcoceras hygrometricum TaxID=472368 RepID=A0A2Z7BZ71_9LAMI|nr:hypothetical protein F511_30091 [Dorcoceras hygrometricum]